VVTFLFLLSAGGAAQESAPLRLVQTIEVPNVEGRLDHITVDVKGKRLFVAGLSNNTVEVLDLKTGSRQSSLAGMSKPQGVYYSAKLHKLFVANGKDGLCIVFDGKSLELKDRIKLSLGADLMDFDSRRNRLYLGNGGKDAGNDQYGEIAVIDGAANKVLSSIRTSAHPGGILVDAPGNRLFATVPESNEVLTIDLASEKILSVWKMTEALQPVSLALDSIHHRLFVGTRKPARILVLDANTGASVSTLETVGLLDGLFFDQKHKNIYATGGEGFISVYRQIDANHYVASAKIATVPIARTSLYVPEWNRLYVALPKQESKSAEVRIYEANQ
jgi:DNA-binding beta-propeller fold protein YncE